jgi:hypothetical protein
MHTSKYGSSALTKSPIVMSNFLCSGLYDERVRYGRKECRYFGVRRASITYVPCTLLTSSAAILGSASTAVTCFTFSSIRTVRLPVPGPTSSTESVGLRFACG